MTALAIGTYEDGRAWAVNFHEPWHTLVTGTTRSGKSVGLYMALAAAACDPSIRVAGLAVNGATLAPFASVSSSLVALGAQDMPKHMAVLVDLVQEMDRRIAMMLGAGVDKLICTPQLPLLLVVIEEFAGEFAAAEAHDMAAAAKPSERLAPRMRLLVGRLLREGAKVGIRCVAVAQRGSADAVGGDSRAQFSRRITFRLTDADSVRMVVEPATREQADALMSAPSGVCLVWEPAAPPSFARAALLDYRSYFEHVRHSYRLVSL